MVKNMKDFGKMENTMVKAFLIAQTGKKSSEYGRITNNCKLSQKSNTIMMMMIDNEFQN